MAYHDAIRISPPHLEFDDLDNIIEADIWGVAVRNVAINGYVQLSYPTLSALWDAIFSYLSTLRRPVHF